MISFLCPEQTPSPSQASGLNCFGVSESKIAPARHLGGHSSIHLSFVWESRLLEKPSEIVGASGWKMLWSSPRTGNGMNLSVRGVRSTSPAVLDPTDTQLWDVQMAVGCCAETTKPEAWGTGGEWSPAESLLSVEGTRSTSAPLKAPGANDQTHGWCHLAEGAMLVG